MEIYIWLFCLILLSKHAANYCFPLDGCQSLDELVLASPQVYAVMLQEAPRLHHHNCSNSTKSQISTEGNYGFKVTFSRLSYP